MQFTIGALDECNVTLVQSDCNTVLAADLR